MTPPDIIQSHIGHLIRRLVARSPLLFFRPGDRGLRMDVADLFFTQPNLLTDSENPPPSEICASPDDLLAKIVAGEDVTVDFPGVKAMDVPMNRCLRMSRENADYQRTTGQWGLSLGWPLIHIPREGGKNPMCAPLLFWKVAARIERKHRRVTICPVEKEPAFNFVLNARMQFEQKMSIEWPEDDSTPEKYSALVGRVKKALSPWEECKTDALNGENPRLRVYRQQPLPSHPAVLPCAVLGMASFKWHALLEELRKLKSKVGGGGDCGLLEDFLGSGMNENNEGKSGEFPEYGKWLVEQSDSSQTAAVCQARESRVMLLEGPPGTGKSQTIVNTIADALRRGERVVVACHHRAALDVVRKRLHGVGLGDLVVQIVAPKIDRDEVVKRVVKIEDDDPPLFEFEPGEKRKSLSRRIEESEDKCDKRTLGFVGDRKATFSARGDLRARIESVREKTGFSPFGIQHEEFLNRLRDKDLDAESAQVFSAKWRECDYLANPWRGIPEDWKIDGVPELRGGFKDLARMASSLAGAGNAISLETLALAGHPMMLAHYPSLAGSGRKQSVEDLLRLVDYTRRVFERAELQVEDLWLDFMRGDAKVYARRVESTGKIEAVQTVARLRREYPALALVAECFRDSPENWPDILESARCYFRQNELPKAVPFGEYKRARENLKEARDKKAEADRADVRARFVGRLWARNALQREGLLRQRAGWGKAKTRLRDIYRAESGHIWEIFPALLTEPDSASQLLPLEPGVVDLLIVDEASQMFTADALPLLFRAKRVVICGDSMQMPPSDFFMMTQGDEEEDESPGDDGGEKVPAGDVAIDGRFELLDAAKHLVLHGSPARRKLEVHYRSRPAELIAFSNHAFYDGQLHAAPDNYAPPSFMEGRAIRMVEVAGQVANGVNRLEIDKTVELLREIWRSPDGRELSTGVIVFNTRQADALKNAIDEECGRDENFRVAYEKAANQKQDGEEVGFFVRSVEHVQGDERDIVILAATYDGDTTVYGPISRKEKGRRRLNVAVTRAKVGMIVLTSLDIDRISNEGEAPGDGKTSKERWFLWQYLRYARAVGSGDREAAVNVLRSVNPNYKPHPVGKGPESGFERRVGEFLESEGYAVDYQKGESGFRIDIGVKADKDASAYLCGIECDGRFYHSGWRARANDIWRQGILESKGWKIRRIWSDEWFDNGEQTKKELLDYLDELRAKCG